jgi:hypothetical protein
MMLMAFGGAPVGAGPVHPRHHGAASKTQHRSYDPSSVSDHQPLNPRMLGLHTTPKQPLGWISIFDERLVAIGSYLGGPYETGAPGLIEGYLEGRQNFPTSGAPGNGKQVSGGIASRPLPRKGD